jgi:hypothetical protein
VASPTLSSIPYSTRGGQVVRRFSALGINRRATSVSAFMADRAEKLRNTSGAMGVPLAAGSWWAGALSRVASILGPHAVLWVRRKAQRVRDVAVLAACRAVGVAQDLGIASTTLPAWVVEARHDLSTRFTEAETKQWLNTLLDVHGFQVFLCPLYNCDPHPGNILLMDDNKIGLIDYGQCMAIDDAIKRNFAELIISIADNRPDSEIAEIFKTIGIRTKKSNDFFIASMARVMFGHATVRG